MRNAGNKRGFTLVEVLVAASLIAVTIVGVMGGIRALGKADAKAHTADLLQSLARQKMNELGAVTDLSATADSGDFADQGYADCAWSVTIEPSGATNVEKVVVTTTRGTETQALTELMYVRPLTGSTGQ
jgi:prepilin-type N-terminal cleavage/methylation domain-containing protein